LVKDFHNQEINAAIFPTIYGLDIVRKAQYNKLRVPHRPTRPGRWACPISSGGPVPVASDQLPLFFH
jgi:hypothetical protein